MVIEFSLEDIQKALGTLSALGHIFKSSESISKDFIDKVLTSFLKNKTVVSVDSVSFTIEKVEIRENVIRLMLKKKVI